MHGKAPRPGLRPGRLLWVAAVLAVCCSASVAIAATGPSTRLAGTWSGSYSGAFTGTFTLHWKQTGSTLHGSIVLSSPKGTYGINGSVNKGKIKFGVVGAGATYTGSWSGRSMSGRYKSPAGSGSWSAHKTS
jgi:hypothetical protein